MAEKMTAGERANLTEAVRVSKDPNATKDQITSASKVQRELSKKYPKTYPAIRGAIAKNLISNMSTGGDAKKKKKKVPVIAISVGMAELPKKGMEKASMSKGGMANGKQHMYLSNGGGSVIDNLPNKGLKALAKSGEQGKAAVRNMGFNV